MLASLARVHSHMNFCRQATNQAGSQSARQRHGMHSLHNFSLCFWFHKFSFPHTHSWLCIRILFLYYNLHTVTQFIWINTVISTLNCWRPREKWTEQHILLISSYNNNRCHTKVCAFPIICMHNSLGSWINWIGHGIQCNCVDFLLPIFFWMKIAHSSRMHAS